MTTVEYPIIDERVFKCTMENGLQLYVVPKRGFEKRYVFFATNYGSIDMEFTIGGKRQKTPAGVAHFLEHKMFDTADGNALQELAQLGAEPNAFTSDTITGYYFEATEHFEECLRILLSFVSVPYFTQESVEKEQGIIGQEIRMIEDDPNWQVFSNLLRGLYRNHPARVPVAGSVESIAEISAQVLYDCHNAFYTPSNMALCVVGDVDADEIAKIAKEILPSKKDGEILRDYGAAETAAPSQAVTEVSMEVALPQFLCGYKGDAVPNGEEVLRMELVGAMACDILFGLSSPLYRRLYEEGLINGEFGGSFVRLPDISFVVVGGESRAPEEVQRSILEEAQRLTREGIDDEFYHQIRKATYGSLLRGLNSFEGIAIGMAEASFSGYDYFRFPEVFERVTKQDIEAFIEQFIVEERAAISIVRPAAKG